MRNTERRAAQDNGVLANGNDTNTHHNHGEDVSDRRSTERVEDLAELVQLETSLIYELASQRHDQVCHRGPKCHHRDWHISNDYVRRERNARVAYLQQLVEAAGSVR